MSDVSLKEFIEKAINTERELRSLQVQAAADALSKAQEVMEQRLEGMNELRDQINRERGHYVSHDVYDLAEERLRSLENSRSNWEGRIWMLGGLFVCVQIVVVILTFILRK